MSRKLIIYFVLVSLVIGLLIYVDASRPKPINWETTYAAKDKIPFGLYVFDKESPQLFKGDSIKKLRETPYEYFDKLYNYTTKQYRSPGTFISIDEASDIDTESAKELIYFAEYGNTVFISSKILPQFLLDTLEVKIKGDFSLKDTLKMNLANNGTEYNYSRGAGLIYFDSIKNKKAEILGYQQHGKDKKPNFIKIPFGEGQFLLHTQPAVFSNYYLLRDGNFKYTEGLASYIPKGNIYWYSPWFVKRNFESDNSLRYILSQPALKWAMWLGLIAIIAFVLFNAKRRQRVIPEIYPLRNTTVDFAKTIGNLYYMERDHHTIIEKKIIYFLEHIRTVYLIDTYKLDDDFIEKLHLKTGKPVEDIKKTVRLIQKHRHEFTSTEADVLAINKAIENLR